MENQRIRIKCNNCRTTGEVLDGDQFKLKQCPLCNGKGWLFQDELPKNTISPNRLPGDFDQISNAAQDQVLQDKDLA